MSIYQGNKLIAIDRQDVEEMLSSVPSVFDIVWSGTVGDFSYTRTAAEHGKGITPQVQCYRDNVQIDCEAQVDLNGDVTVYSNADISGMIIEIR